MRELLVRCQAGSVSVERLTSLVLVAVVGLAGMTSLGDAWSDTIAARADGSSSGKTAGITHVSRQAGLGRAMLLAFPPTSVSGVATMAVLRRSEGLRNVASHIPGLRRMSATAANHAELADKRFTYAKAIEHGSSPRTFSGSSARWRIAFESANAKGIRVWNRFGAKAWRLFWNDPSEELRRLRAANEKVGIRRWVRIRTKQLYSTVVGVPAFGIDFFGRTALGAAAWITDQTAGRLLRRFTESSAKPRGVRSWQRTLHQVGTEHAGWGAALKGEWRESRTFGMRATLASPALAILAPVGTFAVTRWVGEILASQFRQVTPEALNLADIVQVATP